MIQSVRIKNFKNFKNTQIDGFTKLNIITGQNNAGKSNLLEALYYLVGKSMHPCANLTEIYDNIRKEPLTTESKDLMFYGLDIEKKNTNHHNFRQQSDLGLANKIHSQ
ncbi:hypothetical protein HMPREF1425_01506 [Helicobacter pylori GAM71Ai]|nr:hypothetical protein HMPREF1425_01506 [Helicobacter pylori GAM71Ai]